MSWRALPAATVHPSALSSYEIIRSGSGRDIFQRTNTDSNEIRYTLRSTSTPARVVIHSGSSLDNPVMAIAHYKQGHAPRIDIDSTGPSQEGSRVDVRVTSNRRSVRTLTNDCVFSVPSSGRRLQWTRQLSRAIASVQMFAPRNLVLADALSGLEIAVFESWIGLRSTSQGKNHGSIKWYSPVTLDEELAALAMCALIINRFEARED